MPPGQDLQDQKRPHNENVAPIRPSMHEPDGLVPREQTEWRQEVVENNISWRKEEPLLPALIQRLRGGSRMIRTGCQVINNMIIKAIRDLCFSSCFLNRRGNLARVRSSTLGGRSGSGWMSHRVGLVR